MGVGMKIPVDTEAAVDTGAGTQFVAGIEEQEQPE